MSIIDLCNIRYPQPPYIECSPADRDALVHLQAARNICPDDCLPHIDEAMMVILRRYERA